MRPVDVGTKKSEVQREEPASTVTRPSVSASGSRGTFSCRRWRLLSGKPSKGEETLGASVSTHKSSMAAENVQRPTTAAVDSKDWATAATPFAALLPRETIVPTISRKSVAAAVLTSAFPPENANAWDREMTICERKHVKAMGRMATRIYWGKSAGENSSDTSRKQKRRQNNGLKDQIYLPDLCQTRPGGLQPSRAFKSPPSSPQSRKSTQVMANTFAIPDAFAGMKLLSSQLDELRAGLETTRAREISGTAERLWYPQPSHSDTATQSCSTQTYNPTTCICKIRQSEDTDGSSSSLETLLLRVLERPPACPDGYQADQEDSMTASSDGMKTKSLDSRSTTNSEDDLLFLLNTLDSTSQTSSQCETSTTSDLLMALACEGPPNFTKCRVDG